MRWSFALILSFSFLGALPVLAAPGVKVTEDGLVSMGARQLGRVPLPPAPREVVASNIEVAGQGLVHVVISGGQRRAEVLAEASPSGRVLFAGATGPLGVDGEWGQHLRVDKQGVLRYQSRAGAVRCDDQPVYLFPRRYDFSSRRFRPVSARTSAAALPVINAARASAKTPTGAPMNTFKVTFASSQLGDLGNAGNLTPPVELNDGNPATVWAEGLGGDGRGEVIIARSQDAQYGVQAVRIVPGDASSARAFREANRQRSALLILSPKHKYRVVWPLDPATEKGKEREAFWILLPKPVATRCVSLVLETVFPGGLAVGGSGGRTAIGELTFYTELAFGAGGERLIADLKGEDPGRRQAATAALASMGDRGVGLVTALLKGADAGLRERVARILMINNSAGALSALARLLPQLSRPMGALALDALERGGEHTVQAILKLLRGEQLAQEQLVELAPLLGKLGGDGAREALISLAGVGEQTRRAAMVDGLSRLRGAGDASAVMKGAEQASDDLIRADLVLAVGRMPGAPEQGEALARQAAALWRDDAPFELRYRIIGTAGRLDPDGQRALIIKTSCGGDPVLRVAAVDTLRRSASPEATAALVQALEDKDPRVRTSAALSLGRRKLSAVQRGALVARIKKEQWGMVIGQLAQALGAHCGRDAVAALREATRHGPRGYAVDRRALEGMTRCRPRGVGKFLLVTAGDRRWRTGMRTRALSLITPALGKPMAKDLVALFEQLRRGAMRSESDEQVAVAAAGTLGSLGGAEAGNALAGALALEPIPTIRLAAALALGRACQPETRKTLVQASKDAPARVMQAARNSLARCGWSLKKRK